MSARSRLRNSFTFGLTAFVFLLTLMWLMAIGVSASTSLGAAISMGVFTAGFTILIYGYKEFLQRRAFADKKQAGQSTDNHQQRTVEIDLPVDQAYDLALEALQTLHDQKMPVPDDILIKLEHLLPRKQMVKMRETDRAQGLIRAGIQGKTLGIPEFIDSSRIEIRLQKIDANTTQIHIESKTHNIFDMYDMGKNLHYVNQMALYLRRESQQASAGTRLSDTLQDDVDLTDVDEQSDETKRASQ